MACCNSGDNASEERGILRSIVAVLFIIQDVLFWGFSFISTKVVLSQIPPVSIAFFRQIIAASTLIMLVLFTGTSFKIGRRDMGYIVLASFFGIVMYFSLENTGLLYTTASNASMIVAALPIFTLFAEAMLFRLKVTWKMILCLVLSTIGVALVVTVDGKVDLSSARFFGNLLVNLFPLSSRRSKDGPRYPRSLCRYLLICSF